MGTRGPTPKGPYTGKSKVISTKITPRTRELLEQASKAKGRSLSQEIELRLRRTFAEDEKVSEAFGSEDNYLMMRIAGLAIQRASAAAGPNENWLHDPSVFDQAIEVLNAVLQAVRPAGHYQKPDEVMRRDPEFEARQVWGLLQAADPNHPTTDPETKARMETDANLKARLGEIADRPRTFWNDPEALRQRADQIEAATQASAKPPAPKRRSPRRKAS